MRTRKSYLAFAVVIALAVAACGHGRPPLPVAEGGASSQSSATVPDGAAYVADNSLVVGGQTYRLAATAGAPIIGSLSPLAVASPDATAYVYNSWTQVADEVCSGDPAKRGNCKQPARDAVFGRAALRVFTPSSGQDSVLEPGAVSAAWRSDGAIGYFKGNAADVPVDASRFVGHVFVRDSLGSEPTKWTTTAARYVAVAWAGSTLIAYRQFEGERFDVLALSGPGSVRTLATDATVVATSPDGTQLLINHDADGTSVASVVSVATGAVAGSLDMSKTTDQRSGTALNWVTYGGSWDGDLVAAETGAGVALFHVDGGRISFDRVLVGKNPDYGMGVHEPQLFHEKSGKLGLLAWAPIDAPQGRAHAIVTCDVNARSCARNGTRNERNVGVARGNSRPQRNH